MRHAHSVEGERMDSSLPLTGRGESEAKLMRQFRKSIGAKFDVVFSSDFTRAVQTADEVRNRKVPWFQLKELRPNGTAEEAFAAMYKAFDIQDETLVLVVCHNPIIQKIAGTAWLGLDRDYNHFSHSSMLRIDTHTLPPDKHPFHWLVRPSLFESLEEGELIEAARRLRKHLGHAEKAQMVDPLIRKLAEAVARRFRSQARAYKQNKSIDLPPTVNNSFQAAFNNHTRDAYQSGAWHVEQSLDPLKEAVKPRRKLPGYIARSADDLAADIDETSDEQLTSIVHSGEAEGLSTAAVTAAVLAKLHEWTGQRSNTIALNEISKAFHAGGADVADAVGDEVKQTGRYVERHWETQDDPCPECEQNEAAGWIGEDEQYPNFPDGPPGHPNCQCSESYRTAGGEE